MSARRSFLFLQGPVGPFFARLGYALRARGHRVARVNFNGGDVLQWQIGDATAYRQAAIDWPGFVRDLSLRIGLSDVLLFGDCRPRHRMARKVLRPLGARIHVFEEGYFRPDWITCEPEGVNAYSRLPRDPHHYRDAYRTMARKGWPETQPIGPSIGALVRNTIAYYAGVALLAPWFRHHQTHRPTGPGCESRSWIRRALGLRRRRGQALGQQHSLLADPRPFFVLALQLDADMQVRRHSRFLGMSEVIEDTVRSFARAAPPDVRLVVKSHPLDCGLVDFERVLRREAHTAGIGDRVAYLDGGDLPSLLEQARGLVVVNSTAGLSGIHRGVPTLALGKALYDLPGLTHAADGDDPERLDAFWRDPEPPDMSLYQAFRRVVMERTQINGGFYTRVGIERALPLTVEKLEAA